MSQHTVELLYFAIARERAGVASEVFHFETAPSLGQVIEAVYARRPELKPLDRHVRWAVAEDFVRDRETPVPDGATVALIPPVAGGAPERVHLTDAPLDPREVEALVTGPDRGGIVTFSGAVRDHTGDHTVTRLEYEAYAPMALKVMATICEEAEAKWPGIHLALHHRVGVLAIGELAVVVAAASPHRAAAFAACQYIIDRLKEDVPIFKKEIRGDGSIWVGLGP